jgi:hypothetical protein
MSPLSRRDLLQRSASLALAAACLRAPPSLADSPSGRNVAELTGLGVSLGDEGVLLSYSVRLELARDLEQMLLRGVTLVFVAEAELLRERWYWFDQGRGEVVRRWRLGWQPLTRRWKLSQDGLSRHFVTLQDALDAMRRATRWRVADPIAPGEESEHLLAFRFRLDAEELPRPLQIGLGPQSGWDLSIERRIRLSAGMR